MSTAADDAASAPGTLRPKCVATCANHTPESHTQDIPSVKESFFKSVQW
jgi:hypothetical protein